MRPVLVTGAASGIGLATMRLLMEKGASVVGIDRDPLPDFGLQVYGIQADLSNPAEIETAIAETLVARPDIGGLVNCAGIFPVTPILEMTAEEWDSVLSVNLRAPFLVTQALARHWEAGGNGCKVVNVASTAAILARPGVAHYAASKAGLIQLTKVMAIELAPMGIQVNAVAPGLIATEKVVAHAAGDGAAEHAAKLARIPARREGAPEEVALAIHWLLSEGASYATGSVLTLDGGFTLGIPVYTSGLSDDER